MIKSERELFQVPIHLKTEKSSKSQNYYPADRRKDTRSNAAKIRFMVRFMLYSKANMSPLYFRPSTDDVDLGYDVSLYSVNVTVVSM